MIFMYNVKVVCKKETPRKEELFEVINKLYDDPSVAEVTLSDQLPTTLDHTVYVDKSIEGVSGTYHQVW